MIVFEQKNKCACPPAVLWKNVRVPPQGFKKLDLISQDRQMQRSSYTKGSIVFICSIYSTF